MSVDWQESQDKLKRSFDSSPKEWWTMDHWGPIYRSNERICLWLAKCAFNKLTKRFHVPCRKNGSIYTLLYDQLRKRESEITWTLNGVFNERRGGFFDTAWTDDKPDFWLVCDGYLEFADLQPPISRVHDREDTRIIDWVWKGDKGGYGLTYFEGYKNGKAV